jgi:hypothetical protein
MAWDALVIFFERLEREIPGVWPPEWSNLQGELLRETVLREELRLRRVVDRAIRQKVLHLKPQPLASLDAWFVNQRIAIALCACRQYSRVGERVPPLINEVQLRAHMLINFWNEMAADMVREQWQQLIPVQDSDVWRFRHAKAGAEPSSAAKSRRGHDCST